MDDITHARRRARHVEDRPLAPQAQDARGRDPARRRGQRPHVLRRELLRRGRRHPRLVQDSSSSWRASRGAGLAALRHRCRTCTPRPSSRRPAPTTRSSRWSTSWRASSKQRYETIDIDGARVLFPDGLGPRARLEHQPVPDPALRGPHRGRDRRHEARDLRRAPPLPLRDAARRSRSPRAAAARAPPPASAAAPSAAVARRPRSRPGRAGCASSPAARAPSTSTE